MKNVDVIIVGAGIAGLSAAAYSSQKVSTLLLEKEESCGGLVGSFNVDGFILDKGARGIIDSGIVTPMIRQLGINLQLLENPIKMIVEDQSVDLKVKEDLLKYQDFLNTLYPSAQQDIENIMNEIKKVMGYMDVLYGIENPLFLDKPYSMDYLKNTLLPWFIKFIPNMAKAMKMMEPIESYLDSKTKVEGLRHIITQHFFEHTPAFFGLSYFSLYLDYQYPLGSTQSLVDQLEAKCIEHKVDIQNNEEVIQLNLNDHILTTQKEQYHFKKVIWCANPAKLYQVMDATKLSFIQKRKWDQQNQRYASLKGADSILSVYFLVDKDPLHFKDRSGPHAFYTPTKKGLSQLSIESLMHNHQLSEDSDELYKWLKLYLENTTYELSIPVLRDESLAPKGQSGLIVSTLMDYKLTQHFKKLNRYDEFKTFCEETIYSIIKLRFDLQERDLLKSIVSTPLTIESKTYAHQGSVSGYSFKNHPFPVQYQFLKVSQAVKTGFKDIYQAGQFSFNPSGVPVAILTGKLAADRVIKELK